MKIPKEPLNLFPCPVADDGTYKIPPAEKETSGRASLSLGFPEETQLPLNQGGVAPNRMDFNGLFHMLSAFAFWQQSGGQWSYNNKLNYTQPNIVFHKNILWWCAKDNGPATKLVEPGKDDSYWVNFLSYILKTGSDLGLKLDSGNPVGTVIKFYGTSAPEGYFPCTGYSFSASKYPGLYKRLGTAKTPDMRGLFVRGYDPDAKNDSNGKGRKLGEYQGDATRNIKGEFGNTILDRTEATGPFSTVAYGTFGRGGQWWACRVLFDLDKSGVPIANEIRPKNINLLYCIKHD